LCSVVLASGPACRSGPTGPSPVAITAVSPLAGSTFDGTSVTVTGSGFDAGTTLRLGTALAENVQVVSATAITATPAARSTAQGRS